MSTFIFAIPSIGNASSGLFPFVQPSATFVVGDVVRFTGTNWVPSQADTLSDSAVFGFVVGKNGSNYTLATGGQITGLTGLVAGTIYYLSDTVAGKLTATPPTITKPVLYATSTTTGIFYNQWLDGTGSIGVSKITNGTTTANLSNQANWPSGAYSGSVSGQNVGDFYWDGTYYYFMYTATMPIRWYAGIYPVLVNN